MSGKIKLSLIPAPENNQETLERLKEITAGKNKVGMTYSFTVNLTITAEAVQEFIEGKRSDLCTYVAEELPPAPEQTSDISLAKRRFAKLELGKPASSTAFLEGDEVWIIGQ